MDHNSLMEQVIEKGQRLAAGKWAPYVEGLDGYDKITCAILLENTAREIQAMDETTRVVSIGTFNKYVFPLIRAIYPNLVATEICSVQPMTGPASLIFYFDFVYGTSKGNVASGTRVFDSITGPSMPAGYENYSSETVYQETIGTGDSTATVFSGNLKFVPVRAGTITVTCTTGTVSEVDNGAGVIGSGSSKATGTIDYNTGAFTVTFSTAPGASVPIYATYNYNSEGSEDIPQVDILLTSASVTANPRKLRARWGLEAANNLKALYGLDADAELVSAIAELIKFEIDREILKDLYDSANASNTVSAWDLNPASDSTSGVSFTEHKLSLVDKFVQASNNIFSSTKRATGNWIVAAVNVMNIIETLPGWKADPTAGSVGVVRAGVLNGRWTVYKDPYMTTNTYLVGHKGVSFLEAGYVYAPYIPLMTTPTVILDDFIARRGILTQYAKKLVNSRFYAKGSITDTR